MQPFSYDIDRQIRLLFLGSALAAAANLAVTWALALPYLPVYYAAAAAAYLAMARTVRIRRFVPAYCAAFLLAAPHFYRLLNTVRPHGSHPFLPFFCPWLL